MKMRTLLAAALSAILLLSLTACGESTVYDQSAYTPGVIDGNSFSCPQAGIAATLNDEWLIYGPENFESVIGMKQDLADRAMVEDILNAGQPLYELYAAHADRSIVRVAVEDLRPLYGDITAQDYAEIQANHLPTMAEAFSLENPEVQLGTTEIAGQSFPSVFFVAQMVHVPHYEHHIYIQRDNYLYTITLSCVEVDRTAELLSLFTAL